MPALPLDSPSGSNAKWHSSLRIRLALAIALSVAITGLGATWLAMRTARQALSKEVTGIALRAAERAAAELTAFTNTADLAAVTERLETIDVEVGEIATLALVISAPGGARVAASTGAQPTTRGITLAAEAIATNRRVVSKAEDAVRVAVPFPKPVGAKLAAIPSPDAPGSEGATDAESNASIPRPIAALVLASHPSDRPRQPRAGGPASRWV